MNRKIRTLLIKTLIAFFVLVTINPGCTKGQDDAGVATDYSKSAYWLNLPAKLKAADIFYVYPTAWQKVDSTEPNICKIDNATMMTGSRLAYGRQATAFETAGNIYAPYYRQADAIYTLSLPEEKRWVVVSGIPARDVIAAFEYYIEHFNNGRPYILAGHSQGANVLLVLLSEYMKDHPEVYNRMIAAYVIGYPVTAEFMAANPHLKFATGPDDSGVIISYNTQSPGVIPGTNLVVADNVGLVINPITWTRDETLATASQSLGSFMPDATGNFVKVPQYADARVDIAHGVLICSTANEEALHQFTKAFVKGVYHSFDYSFYYYNLRENAENRINKFLDK